MNGDDTQNSTLTFSVYGTSITPSFPPELVMQDCIDLNSYPVNKGWRGVIDVDLGVVTDSDFTALIAMMKSQFDFDSVPGKNKYIEITPRVDNANKYTGWIMTPIDVLNKYQFLKHSIKFQFRTKKLLAKTEFLT